MLALRIVGTHFKMVGVAPAVPVSGAQQPVPRDRREVQQLIEAAGREQEERAVDIDARQEGGVSHGGPRERQEHLHDGARGRR
jgi:hypothetical protein